MGEGLFDEGVHGSGKGAGRPANPAISGNRNGKRRLFTFILAVLAGSSLFFSLYFPVPSPDTWMYLSLGREFFHQGFSVFHHDTFSYLPTLDPWASHEWLACAAQYVLHQGLGPWSLPAFKYLLGLGAAFFLFLAAGKRGASAPPPFAGPDPCVLFF